MAQKSGLSQTAIVRIWHAFGLKPHRTETFKLSSDPYFVEKVRELTIQDTSKCRPNVCALANLQTIKEIALLLIGTTSRLFCLLMFTASSVSAQDNVADRGS